MSDARYDLHGLLVEVSAVEREVLDALAARLGRFACDAARRGDRGAVSWALEPVDGATAAVLDRPASGRPVYDPPRGEVRYDDTREVLSLGDGGSVRVEAELRTATITTWYRPEPAARVLATHPFLTIPLLEAAKRAGMFPLHAGAVAGSCGGLLLAGPSGAGKSTLAFALARAGLAFFADDIVFLDPADSTPRVLAFPDELDLTDRSATMFPELRHLVGRPLPAGRDKHQVRPEVVLRSPSTGSCVPRVLAFPEIAGAAVTTVEPLDRDAALVELAPNVLLTEPRSSQAHLDVLGALTESCRCVRVRAGADPAEAAAVLVALLRGE